MAPQVERLGRRWIIIQTFSNAIGTHTAVWCGDRWATKSTKAQDPPWENLAKTFPTKAAALAKAAKVPTIKPPRVVFEEKYSARSNEPVIEMARKAAEIAADPYTPSDRRQGMEDFVLLERQRQKLHREGESEKAIELRDRMIERWRKLFPGALPATKAPKAAADGEPAELLKRNGTAPQLKWSRFHKIDHWLTVFAVSGVPISADTFNRRVDEGKIRLHPASSSKGISVAIDDLPADYQEPPENPPQ